MLDIKLIKENPEFFKERLATRGKDFSEEIDKLLALDADRRALIADTEARRAKQNAISKEIPKLKKEGKDTTAIFAEMKELGAKIKALYMELIEKVLCPVEWRISQYNNNPSLESISEY